MICSRERQVLSKSARRRESMERSGQDYMQRLLSPLQVRSCSPCSDCPLKLGRGECGHDRSLPIQARLQFHLSAYAADEDTPSHLQPDS